jgi:hypothetical protein
MAFSIRFNRSAIPFSFRIGLWPIGSRRLVDDDNLAAAQIKDVLGRTPPDVQVPAR